MTMGTHTGHKHTDYRVATLLYTVPTLTRIRPEFVSSMSVLADRTVAIGLQVRPG